MPYVWLDSFSVVFVWACVLVVEGGAVVGGWVYTYLGLSKRERFVGHADYSFESMNGVCVCVRFFLIICCERRFFLEDGETDFFGSYTFG